MNVSRVYPTFQLGMYIPDINLLVKIIQEWYNRRRKSVFKSLSKFSSSDWRLVTSSAFSRNLRQLGASHQTRFQNTNTSCLYFKIFRKS